MFPAELTGLPPSRGLEHEIELEPGSCPVARAAYKMSVPEAIELKDQLTQLIDQGFIRPSVYPWLGSTCPFSKKERWDFPPLYRFQGPQSMHD